MKALRRAWHRLSGYVTRRHNEAELNEELQLHIDLLQEENLRRGMSADEARREALLTFGGVDYAKENYRDQRGLPWLETVLQDIRYALRGMRRNPGFTIVAVGCLALGIGANTAIFSVFNAVMLQYLPVKAPEQLVLLNYSAIPTPEQLRHSTSGYKRDSFPYEVFETLQTRGRVMTDVAAFVPTGYDKDSLTVTHQGRTTTADGEMVSSNFFPLLGVKPQAGRTIMAGDLSADAPHVVVISHNYWKREFGGDPAAIGSRISLNRIPFTVIGITPSGFFGVDPARPSDVWIPLRKMQNLQPWGQRMSPEKTVFLNRHWWWCMILGRLKPGPSAEQALAETNALFQSTITNGIVPPPPRDKIPAIVFTPAGHGLARLRDTLSRSLQTLMAAVALVLLITCANIATLLLARARSRKSEMCVRLAIGAARSRLIRQLLTESVLLSFVGGFFGLLLAQVGSRALLLLLPLGTGDLNSVVLDVRLDATVLAFNFLLAVVTGLLFGLVPALRATRRELAGQLRESDVHTTLSLNSGRVLLAIQIALSSVLLFGAGLFMRTLQNLENVDLGFHRDSILLFQIDPMRNGYDKQGERALYRRTLEKLQTLPGVRSASFSVLPLLSGTHNLSTISIDGPTSLSDDDRSVCWNLVGPGFFETTGIPIIMGRGMDWRDFDTQRKVVVVNEAFVKLYYPNHNPIGRRLSRSPRYEPAYSFEIVGIARNAKYSRLREQSLAALYFPYEGTHAMYIEVHISGDATTMTAAVREAMGEIDPTLPLMHMQSQRTMVEDAMKRERMFARLGGLFGVLALVLVAIGLYGTLSYSVARRTDEIGIRMALGAGRTKILWMILRESLGLAIVGLAMGIPLAFALSRWVESILYEVKIYDTVTTVTTMVVLTLVAVFSGFIPAGRASCIEPVEALRCD